MEQRRKQSLLSGAATLLAATLIVKLIGAFFKIPLLRIMGDTGFGYFSGAYNIYTYVYSVSMAGFPIAVARLVSESVTNARYKNADHLFRISKRIFLLIGLFFTALMIGLSRPYSVVIAKAPMNFISIIAIAPCVLMCCMMSAYRGFYEGLRDMVPTAVSQVIEAVVKLAFGLSGAYFIMRYGMKCFEDANGQSVKLFGTVVTNENEALAAIVPFSAAGAVAGVTVGTVFGLLFLMLYNKRHGNPFSRVELVNSPAAQTDKELTAEILSIAIPIAIGALINNITNFIDDATVRWRLSGVVAENPEYFRSLYGELLKINKTAEGELPTYLYGVYNSVLTLKNLIPTITMSLGTGAVPIMASLWSSGDRVGAKKNALSVLRITCMIAFPAGFGLAAVAESVLTVLYNSKSLPVAIPLLDLSAAPVVLFALVTPLSNMLQAIGRTDVPLKAVIIGSLIKTVLNYLLVGSCRFNIAGAAVSSAVSAAFMMLFDLLYLIKETRLHSGILAAFVKPAFCGGLCAAAARAVSSLSVNFLGEISVISLLLAVLSAVMVYGLSMFLVGGVVREDILLLPKGEKIVKKLEKMKLI